MKIVCLQENLKNGFSIAERVSGKNQALPILNNSQIEAKKGYLKVSSTDLEMGVDVLIPCKVEKEGSLVLPSKLVLNFINNLPNTKVSIEEKDGNVLIQADNVKTKIPIINSDDFPIIPKIKNGETITINSQILKRSILQVLNSTSVSNIKPEITGVFFNFKKDELNIVSTDSFRLSEKTIRNNNIYQINTSKSFILPQKTAQELVKIIDSDGDVEIKIEEGQVSFLFDKIEVFSRVLEGEYPDYKRLVPKESKTKIYLNKEEFLSKTKLASIFSSNINDIKIIVDVKQQTLNIYSKDSVKGEFSSDVEVEKIEGENNELVFNFRYLIDGILNIEGDDLVFGLGEESSPSTLNSQKNKDYLYIIMPLKR